MRIDMKDYKLAFELFTIGYREGKTCIGLLRTIKYSTPNTFQFDQRIDPRIRRQFDHIITVSKAVGTLSTPYEYHPGRGHQDGGLVFHPEILTDEYLNTILLPFYAPSDEFGRDAVINATKDMNELVIGVARGRWDEFVGHEQDRLEASNPRDFEISLRKYMHMDYSKHADVLDHFRRGERVEDLAEKEPYCRKIGMCISIEPGGWQEIMERRFRA